LKIESDAGAEFGRWTVDGHPQSIDFPPSFWGKILPAVMADFLRLPWGGPEVGGVLFGSREPGCLRILAFRPLECEHANGPAFELSENDELRLRDLLENARTDERLAGLEAVGWYHSKHHWPVLTERDVKLYGLYFPEPWQIAMVFLRRRSQPCLLTLFFRREDGSIDSSHREFSVREAQPEAAPQPEPAPEPVPEPAPEAALEPEEIAPLQTSLTFWGFSKRPFSGPPASYWSPRHEDTLSKLTRAIRGRKGLVVLTGEAGTGKTALLTRLGDYLTQESIEFALLLDSRLSVAQFYEFLAYDLALPCTRRSKVAVLESLYELLLEQAGKGSTAALLIAGAHHLDWEVLEEIRMLDNLQNRTGRLLQTILCGSPELDRRLESEELCQFRERVAVRCCLQPPSEVETVQWIQRELADCGMQDQTVFTPEILSAIYARSGGILRVTHAICEGLLETCFARGSWVATMEMLDAVWSQLPSAPK
jgi:type II secretory pathway predicted ATPase ExeA